MIHVLSGGTKAAGVIRVSYPANSTLVITSTSSGKQFAKDTNTTSSAKAYIFLAPIGNASYTLTATNTSGKTVSKQVYVAKDQVQSVALAYFSATIKVTYPAKSTCVIKNSSGTQVASDTNTGTAAKTWTATVGATGTYTIVATATDGSGKTKSTTVSITADGQSASVTLSYTFDIFTSGKGMTSGFVMKTLDEDHGWSVTNEKIIWSTDPGFGGAGFWVTPSQDLSKFNTLKIDYKCNARYEESNTVSIGVGPDVPISGWAGEWVAKVNAPYSTTRAVKSVDLSGITAATKYYIKVTAYGITGEIYNIWLE